ncbi:UNVERIFIED_ORG: hypothetical protein ABID33_002620 [Xanthobacter viscosus]|uniref:Cellulose biosynthesis cyclic di-GMP-binding regulatory protein BcsB n=1 Tax=Xanthobacter autotrophicus TaxID=280 RepID=A0A6C1KCC9_XANAU|nr:cellulose biosynthesis cyclic di-GMP-binding regulatory protein BcsB [Xanthobacter autotrophicus]TLX41792.1 cellulose biosynthesis cyclic di-GMP-binding regulatory protein BcsB [Xanthobacter autotrophicus]
MRHHSAFAPAPPLAVPSALGRAVAGRGAARPLAARLAAVLLPAGLLPGLLAGLLGAAPAMAQTADPIVSAIQERAADTRVTRSYTLSDLGIDGPVVLQGMDARRDLYLPVPAGVPLSDAAIALDGAYLRGDGGRTTLVLSVDGTPVYSRRLEGDSGSASATIAVDGKPRPTGFVRLGTAWSSVIGEYLCADERGIGNVLKISPKSRFTYSYEAGAVRDLATAWSGMPGSGSLLVAGGTLTKDTYDTAWRLGLALEAAGKRLVVKTLPAIGDEVDLSGLDVPASLRAVAPFSNFVGIGTYRIKDAADLGALLVLPGSPLGADVAVADAGLLTSIKSALDALGARLGPASAAFTEWRTKAASLGAATVAADEVSLQSLAGRPVIAVGGAAGGKATALFDSFWRTSLASGAVTIRAVDAAPQKPSAVSLASLGPAEGNLDVLARGDFVVSFDLAAVTGGHSLPSRLNLDVAAAPGASTSEPVVAVFLNDVLLAAKRLDATGHPEHLTAAVPPYALAARNVLRVTFQRQPVSDRCRETPQAFPVSVLPTSHFELGGAAPGGDFLGVIAAMASGGRLVVPEAYLASAKASLPRVVRAAAAAGVPARSSSFEVAGPGASFRAAGAFLALDVPVQGITPKARVEGDRLIVGTDDKARLLDISGLKNVALVQALRADDARGIVWQSIGPVAMTPEKPVRLSRGDVALVGVDGTLTELSASGAAPGTVRVADTDGPAGTLQRLWQKSSDWGLPLGIGAAALFFLLLIRASYVRRRGN